MCEYNLEVTNGGEVQGYRMQTDDPDHLSYVSRTQAAKAGAPAAGTMGRIIHDSAEYRDVRHVCGGITRRPLILSQQ